MQGSHLVAELYGCPADTPAMTDPAALRRLCVESVQASGLHAVAELFHRFEPTPAAGPAGITGVVLLAESHLAVHTWPEHGTVTLDVYVCNRDADCRDAAEALMTRLIGHFAPRDIRRQAWARGPVVPLSPSATDEPTR
ncbi:MAG: adenosylmethionine decarboxylase [Burkholderiales bacterium]